MIVKPIVPPRQFAVGINHDIYIQHCADVELAPGEQLTFKTASDTQFDVVRKQWGYYATPSLNGRLRNFNLRSVLVRAKMNDRLYLLLVERGYEIEFEAYVRDDDLEILTWLDDDTSAHKASAALLSGNPTGTQDRWCPVCKATSLELVFQYSAPPAGETQFRLFDQRSYSRDIWRCRYCGHFINVLDADLNTLYSGQYVDNTYGADGLLRSFERIMALPPDQSDNIQRVHRINAFMKEWQARPGHTNGRTLLDIGSGLAVFPARMRDVGWECTALDPDPRAAEHARNHAHVAAICGNFMDVEDLGSYDLVTLNKVLEHVPNAQAMLVRSRRLLRPRGIVYVEVPDGEAARHEGSGREEYFIEHVCAFSLTSLSLLASRANLTVQEIERVREPSKKFTLRAFLS